jgi:pilus assembly protein CpaF
MSSASKPAANIEGRGAIPSATVRNALRMRPDRIIVGECRGGESLDMLQAMNTATTVAHHRPRQFAARCHLAPRNMVRCPGSNSLQRHPRTVRLGDRLVVHESRLSDGSRK